MNRTAYKFQKDDGTQVTLRLTFGELMDRLEGNFIQLDDGQWAKRVHEHHSQSRHAPVKKLASWPLTPESIAINPEHVAGTMEVDRKHGVPTDYTRDGAPIITGPAHYRKYLALHGFHHRNAGYGDRPPP